jgi:magnesium-transporting ATPase (P-type)
VPFAVDYTPEPGTSAHVIALLAGPAFSLVSGAIGIAVDRIAVPLLGRPFWRMVWVWTIFTSVQEGLGYLQITAIMGAGDTAQAFDLMGLSSGALITATIIGWAGLPVTAWLFAGAIRPMCSTVREKRALAVWPWIIGTVVLLVLMTIYVLLGPVKDAGVIVAVLAGALAVGIFAPISMMFGTEKVGADKPLTMHWPATGGLILLVILVAVNLVLTQGWIWP